MEDLIRLAQAGNFQVSEYATWREYMEKTTERLKEAGDVTDGFFQALTEREEKYPTGLETMTLAVAIPHAEFKYVNREMIDVTVFSAPVMFHRMDEPESEIPVRVACMLLLKEPHAHLKALQELMQLFQSEQFQEVVNVETKEKWVELLKGVGKC